MDRLAPGTPRRREARGPRRAGQHAMYSSYDLSSFAWFIRRDGPKGSDVAYRKTGPVPNRRRRHRLQYPTGGAPKVLARSFVPAEPVLIPAAELFRGTNSGRFLERLF